MTFPEAVVAGAGLALGAFLVLVVFRVAVKLPGLLRRQSATERGIRDHVAEERKRRTERHDWPSPG